MLKRQALTILTLTTLLVTLASPAAILAIPQATTYTVNSNGDLGDASIGDGTCSTSTGACTLRAAIQEANAHTGSQTINFASQFQAPSDINIASCDLPAITADFVTIDASNRWDTGSDRPGVEITGSVCDGLLTINADGITVLGLFFGGGASTGIKIINTGGGNSIGGWNTGQRNVFLTGKYGVYINSSGTYNYVINNYFGTANGTTIPGGPYNGERGIFVQAGDSYSVISGNLIVGQSDAGILLWANSNVVMENIVGLDKSKGAALPNNVGVQLYGDWNIVGQGNTIAGNNDIGMYVYHSDDSLIYSNFIGYPYGIADLGNKGDGIRVHSSQRTTINSSNIIAKNDGFGIHASGSNNTVIQGNGISGSDLDGVYFENGDGTIGGIGSNKRNIISSNGGNGIRLNGTSAMTVTGNYIGLSDLGVFDYGNTGHGVLLENGAQSSLIGGTDSGAGNWIAWNGSDGVRMDGSSTQYNYLVGNVIGAPVTFGWEAPNGTHGVGIYNGAHNNYVGTIEGGNTIIASGWSGVAVVGSDYNAVLFNSIGTNGVGANWGNTYFGVDVFDSINTSISYNEIAYNGTAGGTDSGEAGIRIRDVGSTGNIISQNSIHTNDGPGILLLDGSNGGLTAPTITSASCNQVQGTTSPVCANCLIEVFSDSADEGRVYEGHFTTPPDGTFTWNGVLNGPKVTVTARRNATGDTSPFSAEVDVGTCNYTPVATFTVDPEWGYTHTVITFDGSGSSDVEDGTAVLKVRWDWDNNGVYDTGWSTTKTATHSFPWIATHTVRMEVMDTKGLTHNVTRDVAIMEEFKVYAPFVVRGP